MILANTNTFLQSFQETALRCQQQEEELLQKVQREEAQLSKVIVIIIVFKFNFLHSLNSLYVYGKPFLFDLGFINTNIELCTTRQKLRLYKYMT